MKAAKDQYKRWSIWVACMAVAGLIFTAACNYFIDPYGYFTYQSGKLEDAAAKGRQNTSYVQREYKLNHVIRYADEYDAYLIGGSKAGSYRAQTLSELDGLRYYNMFNIAGSFAEYEQMTQFLIEHGTPQKIIVQISGNEIRYEETDQSKINFYHPALLTGKSKLWEYVTFLFKSVKGSAKRLMKGGGSVSFTEGGERTLAKLMNRTYEDWEGYTQKYVLSDLKSHLHTLFTTNRNYGLYDSALAHIQRMKDMCDEAGVELVLLFAPSFITQNSYYESTYYRDFLLRVAMVTDYWDFSGYNDINRNPYNFYNEGHFFYEIGDLVIHTMAGTDSYPGFGTYVTKENVMEHIQKRTADYEALRQEYQETGTIRLQGMTDPSCIYSPPERPV